MRTLLKHMEQNLKFDLEALLAEASRQVNGPQDFGDPSFRKALEVLCHSIETEAKLSPLGRQLLHGKFIELLVNRLRIEEYFKRHPEIEQETLAAPLVIVGLPRTGTTLLQRLLACDPQLYSMPWWESRYPVPFPGESLQAPTQRIERARGEVAVMVEAMPKLLSIHPMDADQADEEVMLMEHSFRAAFNAYVHVPSYMNWLHGTNEKPAYDYLKRVLKFLQWQKRQRGISGQRWVLKAPHHLLRMKLLLEEFPGARIIQSHRDPVDTIPSIASFIDTLWHIYSSDVD
ncbi:MAG: sulfotransferase family protein, partial [Nevskiales bacterium]